uniref:C3H1-type domain-containing protein n=1 Tax=Nyssomyia neivai TaxID=330878 RepID=A0A1L8DDI3_9DIPT
MDDQVLPVKFKSIHINPKFRNAHINPSFFTKPPTITSNIHVNPKFLALPAVDALPPNPPDVPKPPPIYKTRRKLIRSIEKPPVRVPQVPSTRLVKISKNKLIRTSHLAATPKKSLPGSGRKNLYKIDRRIPTKVLMPQNQRKLRTCFSPKIVTTTNRKLMRIGTSFVSYSPQKISRVFSEKPSSSIANHSKNRKLHFLNINGVLYKSTANKLQKSSPNTVPKVPVSSKKTHDRVLFIRGEKFTVDGNGKRLRKSNTTTSSLKLSRIHFGGLTYTANKNGTYERTNSHFARTHLSIAKQRSISFLANKMVKSNLPCLIYRRLGKCLARERGRCHRVHDPEQVAVCRKFLKGACKDSKCLLAHKADLSKMPTCKFFLEGCCTAADCPYLHKKLNEKTEICRDFLQGFCKLAEKCSKRHDLICPNIEKNGVCDKSRCPFPHPQKKVKNLLSECVPKPPIVVPKDVRYFMDTHECDDEVALSEEGQERLARTLAKVNKMKRNYWNNGETSGENNCTQVPNISSESVESIIVPSVPFSRPPIGDLPNFIPI